MEHEVSQLDIIINVVVQFLNIALFFYLFIRLAGKGIAKLLDEKIAKEKKLADADKEYAARMADAQEHKERLLEEALSHKKQLVIEAKAIAEQEKEDILKQARHEAQLIIEKAHQEAILKWRDLDDHFIQGVKTAAMAVVKKLFASKTDVQESYVQWLVDEFMLSYKH